MGVGLRLAGKYTVILKKYRYEVIRIFLEGGVPVEINRNYSFNFIP
jgi:hypothetical protein